MPKKNLYLLCLLLPESRYCVSSLSQCALPRRQQDACDQLRGTLGGKEGVDQGGAGFAAQTYV